MSGDSVNSLTESVQQLRISDAIHDDLRIITPEGPPFVEPFDLGKLDEFILEIRGGVLLMKALCPVMTQSTGNSTQGGSVSVSSIDQYTVDLYIIKVSKREYATLDDSNFRRTIITPEENKLLFMDFKRTKYSALFEKLKDSTTCNDLLQAGCQIRWYRGILPLSMSRNTAGPSKEVSLVALEKAFNAPFVSTKDETISTFTSLCKYLSDSRKLWNKGQGPYLALVFSILQGSGSGKTRVIKELHSSKEYRVIYICCRDPDVISYPLTTRCYLWLLSQVQRGADFIASCMKFVFCVIIAYEETIKHFPNDEMVPMSSEAEKHFHGIFHAKVAVEKTDDIYPEAKQAVTSLTENEGPPILLVLDEGRSLLNLVDKSTSNNAFVQIRRVLYQTEFLVRTSRFATIVLDTNSPVTNFAPPPSDQSSGRFIRKDQHVTKLFQPFYAFTNYSILAYPDFKPENVRQIRSLSAQQDKAQLMALLDHKHRHLALITIGRPLWAATFRSTSEMNLDDPGAYKSLPDSLELSAACLKGIQAVSEVARLKLANGHCEYQDNCASTLERMFLTSVACFSVVTGMPISTSTIYAKSLMSSHAAWLHFISEKQSWLEVGYLQEPALVEASLAWQGVSWIPCYWIYDVRAMSDLLTQGQKGNCIARYSLAALTRHRKSLAYTDLIGSRVTPKIPFSRIAPKVKLAKYFCMLGVPVQCWQEDLFGSLSVNCSHFIQLFTLPTETDIRNALVYGHGIMLPPCNRGAYCAIPAVDDDGKVSLILAQIKCCPDNSRDKPYHSMVVQKLSPQYIWEQKEPELSEIEDHEQPKASCPLSFLTAAVPYIGILVQFGGGNRPSLRRDLAYFSDGSMRACIVVPDETALPCLKMYGVKQNRPTIKSIILDSVRNYQVLSNWKDKNMGSSERKMAFTVRKCHSQRLGKSETFARSY